MKTVGETIKEIRTQKGITLEQLGYRSGISHTHIWRIEKGLQKNPRYNTLQKIAGALGVNTSIFYYQVAERKDTAYSRPQPVYVPIYEYKLPRSDIPVDPTDYWYLPTKYAGKELEGYICRGDGMYPYISDGDIVIIDMNADMKDGDICGGFINGVLHLGHIRSKDDKKWLYENSDFNLVSYFDEIYKVVLSIRWKEH